MYHPDVKAVPSMRDAGVQCDLPSIADASVQCDLSTLMVTSSLNKDPESSSESEVENILDTSFSCASQETVSLRVV